MSAGNRGVGLPYRIRVLGGGLQLDFPGQIAVPTAPREVGALVALALNPGRELALESLKIALFDVDPGLVSKGAIQTPVSRLRKAGLPIPLGRYVLEVEPSDVDVVDVDLRARAFIEAAADSKRLGEGEAAALLRTGTELHELWRHDPADAVGHDPVQSKLFDPHRRRHRRFGMAFVRLLSAVGETGRALEVLDEYVDRYGDDAHSSALRDGLLEAPTSVLQVSEWPLQPLDVGRRSVAMSAPSGRSAVPPTEAIDWPVQVGRPPRQARAFQQREALDAEITSGMASGGSAVLTQVVGDGGVGKTQLAAAVFSRARDDGVELLVWVEASSRESIVTTYAQARGEIESGTVFGGSAEESATAFLSWLGSTKRSWLVVLDDVADPADVRGLWPDGSSGRVVATTRRRDLAPAGAQQVTVGVFAPEEAHGYLEERLAGSPAQPAHPRALDEAAELAEDLGRLPVAVAQAAAVILNQGITCAEYRRRFADQAASFDRLFPADAGADDYAHTVATTWSLAVDLADRLPPVGFARPALHIAAVLDPNGAPDTIWATTTALRFLASQLHISAVPADHSRTALRNLHRLSLLKHDPAGGALSVRTHALVQRAALEPLTGEQRAEVVRVAADALAEIWPSTENDPGRARAFRQNTATLAGRVDDVLWLPEPHEVLFRAGRSLGELGLAQDAITYWTEMETTATRLLGPDHPQTLTICHDLADSLGDAGDMAGAAEAFEALLYDCLRVFGPDHPSTLAARNDLADWRGAVGDAVGAARALEELLVDRLRVLGPEHPDTLTTRHDLAYWWGAAGDVVGAAEAFEELLVDRLRLPADDPRDRLLTRRRLADWRGVAGDASGAVDILVALLDDKLQVLGPEHPDTLTTRHHLAYWRGVAGDGAGATEAFEELLWDQLRVLGSEHPDTLFTRYRVADFRGAAGDAAGAVEMLSALLWAQLRVLGPEHPDTLFTRHGRAHWQGAAGDGTGAAEAFEDLLRDQLRVLGPSHLHTFCARQDMAYVRGVAGDGAGAVEMLSALLEDQLRLLGPGHLHTLATRHGLASFRGAAGDAGGAARAFEELLTDRSRLFGPSHFHTLATRQDLVHWLVASGDDAGAAHASQLLASHDPQHPTHSHPSGPLAECNWRCGIRGPRIRRPVRRPSAWTKFAPP